jgi:hypothetical protein
VHPPYTVIPYSIDELRTQLVECSRACLVDIDGKIHKQYFSDYFDELAAKSIVIEYEYVDHDYLEDFANYYVKCFQDYDRKCTRLHFFNVEFTSEQFAAVLAGANKKLNSLLRDSYLGFIIVKPLPRTIIGRTCLKTYPIANRRFFPVTRSYPVNIFGLPLEVNTLAYQEQDQVAAACATSALWSIFQRTGILFHHPIPTPIEITKSATYNYPTQVRTIPNHGLTLEQMSDAIRDVGLEPFLVNVANEYNLKSAVYSFLRAGVPVAFAIVIIDASINPSPILGHHAVAVTGYSLGRHAPIPEAPSGFLSKASRIDKIYVHDDQIGPFARMEIDGKVVEVIVAPPPNPTKLFVSLSTSWMGQNKVIGSCRAIPQAILVPLHHKIRITYDVIERTVINFDSAIEIFRVKGLLPLLKERVEWDIFLSTNNPLKEEILAPAGFDAVNRTEVLTEKMPRYIWRSIAFLNGQRLIELVFDATDIEQGNFFIMAIKYDEPFFVALNSICSVPSAKNIIDKPLVKSIFDWIRKN